ncbi:SDR family NAD(P)-dependent oxidoreductase [Candidatus Lucifugimonas marina]|uniref:Glucose 1-dehydrogenase n=1 Tax=Candidatus Lucifugimonas marina TaxID=3038979 RepID=A0AAJ5ZEP0_9CHLR|nr:glucose 1-dehydrogenase [SAR202 cluster bacterium JH639]WFG34804.1 glucose 1-dehydrogenase [SAR202 cluster bacterium JH545]WFG38744.1 glucose 1-dehydrogenase [SAR202 cluster bacterium JH1073]
MYGLDSKVAIVTGAGGKAGIGRGIATRLAAEGATIVVSDLNDNGTPDWGGLSAVVDEINAGGGRAIGLTGSVSDSDDVTSIVEGAISAFGQVDILVNNAGAPAGPDRVNVVDLPEEVWDQVLGVNLKGTFLMSQAISRHMIQRGGGGKIINMSSVSGKVGNAKFAAYCSSKFGVIGFTQSLSREMAEHKVNVNAICPSLVETERVFGMASALKPDEETSTEEWRDEMVAQVNSTNPLGRIAQPEDVADVAAFLASSQSDYLTGLAINVAGGSWMG